MSSGHHICICICTYKRPEFLVRLLAKLETQETGGLFGYSIVIVDNDKLESARPAFESYLPMSKVPICYYVEPEQNISMARNRAIKEAKGTFIGFIDDDELPSDNWLLNLYKAFEKYRPSGGILGPVNPYYPEGTPRWLIKSKICVRPSHKTGTILNWNMTRTGNALVLQKIFTNNRYSFDPKKGRTGGEDKKLFKLLMEQGYTFIWCQEAEVNEYIYPERWKLSHYLHRSLLNGGDIEKEYTKNWTFFLRSLASLVCYTFLLCFSVCCGKCYTYKRLIRVVYDFARIMGCLGIVFEKERRD